MNTECREKIEKRAYELYVERGGTHGCDLEDWLRAEQEVLSAQPQEPAPAAAPKPAPEAAPTRAAKASSRAASGAAKPRSRTKKTS